MGTIYTSTRDKSINLAAIGAVGTTPAAGSYSVIGKRIGNWWSLHFTFTGTSIPVTDGGASGASGSLKIFDFVEGAVQMLGSRHNWTAFSEGSAGLTTSAGDAVFVIAFGSVAANVGDGVLTSTEVDFGATRAVTMSSGAGTGATTVTSVQTPLDGTGTAVDIYLNWCGTAATIDGDSTILVTGTATFAGCFLNDD